LALAQGAVKDELSILTNSLQLVCGKINHPPTSSVTTGKGSLLSVAIPVPNGIIQIANENLVVGEIEQACLLHSVRGFSGELFAQFQKLPLSAPPGSTNQNEKREDRFVKINPLSQYYQGYSRHGTSKREPVAGNPLRKTMLRRRRLPVRVCDFSCRIHAKIAEMSVRRRCRKNPYCTFQNNTCRPALSGCFG
jgi:hypothetical protein